MERNRMRWEDGAAYTMVLAGIDLLLGILFSLLRLEFMPDRRKPFLLCGLGLAIFAFSILAMGQNVVGEHEGVAELYLYAGATGVLIGLVLLMPPYRAPNWISVRGAGR